MVQVGVTVGPSSVGYKLTTEALVFGGNTITATDVAVASELCGNIGDKERTRNIPKDVRVGALEEIKRKIENAVDQVKVSYLCVFGSCYSLVYRKANNLSVKNGQQL